MSPFHKKRRQPRPGPNKNQKKVMRGQEAGQLAHSAGLLRDQFPAVDQLAIQLEFITPQHDLFEKESRVFGPSDVCDLSVPCLGRCEGRGQFDLAGRIRSLVESRQTRADSSGICQQSPLAGSTTLCGFRLNCRIEIAYRAE
jgi:hypothetical protein